MKHYAHGSFEYKGTKGSEYIYDANGSLVADRSRGIAYIAYDLCGNPQSIYFMNGREIRYTYSATGEKLRVMYYMAVPNVTKDFGVKPPGSTNGQVMCVTHSDYLLGGMLTLKNDLIDMVLFDGGYAKATRINNTTYGFTFYYYDRDHLGSVRQVIEAEGTDQGTIVQKMNYYPSGLQFCNNVTDSDVQPLRYNGKELDRMHGLNTYDYGARQYNPVTARWDRMDPLCEKYYDISPYAYCHGDPVNRIDIDGKDDYYSVTGRFIGSDNKQTDHIMISLLPYSNLKNAQQYSLPIENCKLTPSVYSNIFTDIVSRDGEMDLSLIHNSKISVTTIEKQDNFYTSYSYNDGSTELGSIASTIRNDNDNIITAFIFQDYGHSDEKNIFTTVSNVINILVGHEYNGHVINNYSDENKNHHLVFENQMKHHSWSKTTEAFKEYEMDIYEKVKKREQ